MKCLCSLFCIAYLFTNCTKDNPIVQPQVEFRFENVVGKDALNYSNKYVSPGGDTFSVSQFKYYVSNIVFYADDKIIYKENESYHLIDHLGKLKFKLKNAPQIGNYTSFSFAIGIDSSYNHRIDYSGDLDPNNNMSWDWNTGYKFLLFEGEFITKTKKVPLIFHIGEDTNFKTLKFIKSYELKLGKILEINIQADINKMFLSPNSIDFDVMNEAMFGKDASKIAQNYANGMFSLKD